MGKKQGKVPKRAFDPQPGKVPRVAAAENADDLNPSWRIGLLECQDDFGAWHRLDPGTLHEIRSKLRSFESMTWHEILVDGKNRHHSIQTKKLVPRARTRLAEVKLDDLDELVSLALTGTQRIFGIRDHGVLKLLWWDPEHKICPSVKKHT
jgi:hypothetical protein